MEIDTEQLSSVLSRPQIDAAEACTQARRLRVSLRGGKPGNYYYVYEYDPSVLSQGQLLGRVLASGDADGITYAEISLNAASPLIGAVQVDANRNVSEPSNLFQVADPATRTEYGRLPWAVFACGRATVSDGHLPGDKLTLSGTEPGTGRYTRFVVPEARSRRDYVPAGSPEFRFEERVRLRTDSCNYFNREDTRTVLQHAQGARLPPLRFDGGRLIPGAPSFIIRAAVEGALQRFELVRGGNATQWSAVCVDFWCTIHVPSPLGDLQPGDDLTATQELCDGTTSTPETGKVPECGDMEPASLMHWPRHGDVSNTLTMTPAGVMNVVLVGDGFGPRDNLRVLGASWNSTFVGFSRPLTERDTWLVVAQPTSACPAPLATDYSIVP